MALALPPAGHIWTIDPDADRTQVAATYLERAGKHDAVEIINQPALEILPTFYQRNLDIVFIDAIKTEYEDYLECVRSDAQAFGTRDRRQFALGRQRCR